MDARDVEGAMERWGDAVWRLCLSRLRHRADAEDAFQETFMALFRTDPDFTSDEHEKAWLLRCACNCVNDVFRSRKKHRTASLHEPAVAAKAAEASLPDPADDANAALEAALARLTDNQSTAVHLHYYEGYSVDETAAIMGQKPSTVRSHLHRARKALKLGMEASFPCETTNSSVATANCRTA